MWKVIKVLENHRFTLPREDRPTPQTVTRICREGHRYHKSSTCPSCPICERAIPMAGDLPHLAAPARRALEKAGISSLQDLSQHRASDILALHGIGAKAMGLLRIALLDKGVSYRE